MTALWTRRFSALLVALGCAPSVRAQSTAAVDTAAGISVEVSTSDMVRRTAIFISAGQVLNRATDAGLDAAIGKSDGRGTRGILTRLGRLWFVNLPIAALAQGAAHDSGHIARWAEFSDEPVRRHIKQWPWPIPIAVSVEYVDIEPPLGVSGAPRARAVIAGGEQGSTLTKQRLGDEIYRHDTATYFDWVLLAYSSLDYPVYAWTDLRQRNTVAGDFSQYSEDITVKNPPPGVALTGDAYFDYVAADARRKSDRLRHDAWLNLIDFSLWQSIQRVGRYVATGERSTRNAAISVRGVGVVPAAYGTLTSLGPERGMDLRFIATSFLTRVNLRCTTDPSDLTRRNLPRLTASSDRLLWGSGLALRSRDSHRFLPEATIDVWQRPDKSAGIRIEAGTMHALTIAGRPWEASVRLGYKSEGYLLDAPQRATPLASVRLSARF